jgi:hypothetical protein
VTREVNYFEVFKSGLRDCLRLDEEKVRIRGEKEAEMGSDEEERQGP